MIETSGSAILQRRLQPFLSERFLYILKRVVLSGQGIAFI